MTDQPARSLFTPETWMLNLHTDRLTCDLCPDWQATVHPSDTWDVVIRTAQRHAGAAHPHVTRENT